MKNLITKFIFFFVLLFATNAVAQVTPFTMLNSYEATKEKASRVSSFDNAWLGADLLYNVSGDVSGSFLLNARGLYMAASGANYGVPVLTNVALNQADTLNDEAGVRFGVYPYYVFANTGRMKLVAHSGLAYNILDKKDVDTETQFRVLAGIEAAFYPSDNGSPFTLSVAPEYVMNIQSNDTDRWQLSVTGVLPIAQGLGLLIESQTPFAGDRKSSIQFGVIANTELTR